jgi:hypothetical protein
VGLLPAADSAAIRARKMVNFAQRTRMVGEKSTSSSFTKVAENSLQMHGAATGLKLEPISQPLRGAESAALPR